MAPHIVTKFFYPACNLPLRFNLLVTTMYVIAAMILFMLNWTYVIVQKGSEFTISWGMSAAATAFNTIINSIAAGRHARATAVRNIFLVVTLFFFATVIVQDFLIVNKYAHASNDEKLNFVLLYHPLLRIGLSWLFDFLMTRMIAGITSTTGISFYSPWVLSYAFKMLMYLHARLFLVGLNGITQQIYTTVIFVGLDGVVRVVKPSIVFLLWRVYSCNSRHAMTKASQSNRSTLQDFISYNQMVLQYISIIYSNLVTLIIVAFTHCSASWSTGELIGSMVAQILIQSAGVMCTIMIEDFYLGRKIRFSWLRLPSVPNYVRQTLFFTLLVPVLSFSSFLLIATQECKNLNQL